MSELKEDKISILIELVASLNDRLEKLEKQVYRNRELSNTVVDTENYFKIPQGRSPSLGGEKIEEETIPNTEDVIKEKVRKAVDQILEYSKGIDYIQNK